MSVFLLFLLATAVGSISTFFWIPEDDLGRGYFVTNALVVLGLLGLAAAVVVLHPFEPFGEQAALGLFSLGLAVAGGFWYYAAVWRESWRWGRLAAGFTLAAGLGALALVGAGLPTPDLSLHIDYRLPLLLAGLVVSALLLGWSLITMLLGHWYLVAPRLTFRYLVFFCWVLVAMVMLRLVLVGITLAEAHAVDSLVEPHPLQVLIGFGGQGMFFWFRLLWGLALPLALSWMALHCARQRANQSATGILYVLVVGTFIGEVTAYYLTLTTGMPV